LSRMATVMLLTLLLPGCTAEEPREVRFSARSPDGLTLRGTVFGATLSGTRGEPLAGVQVRLSGGAATTSRATSAAGEFAFTDLATGVYRVIAEKEGYQRAFSEEVALMPGPTDLPDGTTVTVDLDLRSNPVLLAVLPPPDSTVVAETVIPTLLFDERMDPTTVRGELWWVDQQGGVDRRVSVVESWDEQGTTLTLAPRGRLPVASRFEIRLTGNPRILDLAGFPLDLTGAGGGLTQTTFTFTTAAGGLPGPPTGLVVAGVGDRPPAELDWAWLAVAEGGAAAVPVHLTWVAPVDLPGPEGYLVYASCGTGPVLLADEIGLEAAWSGTLGGLAGLLHGAEQLDPVGRGNVPAVSCPLRLEVTAFNRDGESPPAVVELRDGVAPALVWAGRDLPAAELPAIPDGGAVYLGFSEPVRLTAKAAGFQVTADGTPVALGAAELAWPGGAHLVGDAGVGSVVRLTFAGPQVPGVALTVEVRGGASDLLGNVLEAEAPGASYGPFPL